MAISSQGTAIISQGDVVKVPFPYTDRSTRQSRPALVVSTGLQESHSLVWVVMITSADNRPWPDDVAITNLSQAGLPAPSVIRTAKIATIDVADASRLGKVSAAQLRKVVARLGREIGVTE
jgi:mRNA interferase MazF